MGLKIKHNAKINLAKQGYQNASGLVIFHPILEASLEDIAGTKGAF